MKNSKWIPTFRSGTRFTDGFMTGLAFTQKNQKSGLREAKFFNSGNGLQVMSNVYDFSFTLDNVKPNNMLFPGQLIWFELHDFDNADIDPNTLNTLANVLSMGGYYMIKSVSHTFDIQKGKFTIKYDTLWNGGDTSIKFRRHTYKGKTIETNAECLSAYDKAMERASLVDPTVTGGVTSFGELAGRAIPVDSVQAERLVRQIRNRYDYSDSEDRKSLEGNISAYLQSSGDAYKNSASREFTSANGQYALVNVTTASSVSSDFVAIIEITYSNVGGFSSPGGRYKLNTKTGNMIREI